MPFPKINYKWFIAPAILVAIPLIPVKKVFISEWRVHVTSYDNTPVPGIRVWEEWNNFEYGQHGMQDLSTDANGIAVFPAVAFRKPISYWIVRPIFASQEQPGEKKSIVISSASVSIIDRKMAGWTHVGCADAECTKKLEAEIMLAAPRARLSDTRQAPK